MRRWSRPKSILSVSLAAAGALVVVAMLCGAAAAAPRASTAASPPSCATSGLVIWLDTAGSGTAGGTYYNLELTNLSGHSCTLKGYPGVSAVNLANHQLGSAASRDAAVPPGVIALASGTTSAPVSAHDTATVILKITDVGVYGPASCGYASAAGLRVYPPGSTTAKIVPFAFTGCSRAGSGFLSVEAAEKAVLPQ